MLALPLLLLGTNIVSDAVKMDDCQCTEEYGKILSKVSNGKIFRLQKQHQ